MNALPDRHTPPAGRDDCEFFAPHWAFTPPVRPAVPDVKETDWVQNDVDRFVLEKIEAAGLQPAPEAARAPSSDVRYASTCEGMTGRSLSSRHAGRHLFQD